MDLPQIQVRSYRIPHRHQIQIYHTDGTFVPFGQFSFTGSVKPLYPLSPRRIIPEHIPRPDYATDGRAMSMLRHMKVTLWAKLTHSPFSAAGTPHSEIRKAGQPPRILSAAEQEKMRTVCRVCFTIFTCRVTKAISRFLSSGLSFWNPVCHDSTPKRFADASSSISASF